jgi:hypothetical protein
MPGAALAFRNFKRLLRNDHTVVELSLEKQSRCFLDERLPFGALPGGGSAE